MPRAEWPARRSGALGKRVAPRDKHPVNSLPLFLVTPDRAVILIGDGDAADAKRRLLERAGARIVGEAGEASIAFVAMDAPEAAVARLRARGILVNVVDRPDLCDFFVPAIVDRDPVMVSIGTGGVSAGFAAALRQRIERFLPADLGALAGQARQIRHDMAEPAERRRRIAALLDGGRVDGAGARLEQITIRSPDPDELTLRAARLLGIADRLYHPADLPAAILDRARADAVRIVGPAPALPEPGLSLHLIWMPE